MSNNVLFWVLLLVTAAMVAAGAWVNETVLIAAASIPLAVAVYLRARAHRGGPPSNP